MKIAKTKHAKGFQTTQKAIKIWNVPVHLKVIKITEENKENNNCKKAVKLKNEMKKQLEKVSEYKPSPNFTKAV